MKKAFLFLGVLFIGVIIVGIALNGKKQGAPQDSKTPTKDTVLLGFAGYTPAHFPQSDVQDAINYWAKIHSSAHIYGIHASWKETNTILSLAKQANMPVELTVGLQDPSDWSNPAAVTQNIKKVLAANPDIKYVGIGNEINLLATTHAKEFPQFVSAFNAIAADIKATYPQVKIFTTFQYDALRRQATLLGPTYKNGPSWELLKQFDNSADIYAFTVYPFLEYKSVKDIPQLYLSEIATHTAKSFAITETSWPTQNNIAILSGKGYQYSEIEQSTYITYLKTKSSTLPQLKFITVAFLTDYRDWNSTGNSASPLFDSIGLHYNDGTEKKAFAVWNEWAK